MLIVSAGTELSPKRRCEKISPRHAAITGGVRENGHEANESGLYLVALLLTSGFAIHAQDGARPFVPVTDAMLQKPSPRTG